jgi:hypothetical protein
MRDGQQTNYGGGRYVLWGDANTPFIPNEAPTSTLFVYKLKTTWSTIYGTYSYTYDLDTHGIAYNFKTALWEDYGTKTEFGSQAATMVVGPYFVVQTGDLVRLKDINHYELGRFTDPYYIWSLNNPDSPPPPLPPPSPPPSPPTPPPIPRPYSTSSIDITADHVEGQWKSLLKRNMDGGRYVLWQS